MGLQWHLKGICVLLIRLTSGLCFVSYVHSFPVCADCCYYTMSYMFSSVCGTGLWNDRLEWSVLSSINPWTDLVVHVTKSLQTVELLPLGVFRERHSLQIFMSRIKRFLFLPCTPSIQVNTFAVLIYKKCLPLQLSRLLALIFVKVLFSELPSPYLSVYSYKNENFCWQQMERIEVMVAKNK